MRRARNLMYQQHESEADRNDKRAAEARLRRLAMSRGLVLRKQRRLDKNAYDYGRYRLYGPNGIQVGNEGIAVFGLSLDQVEEYRITGKMPVFPTKPLGQLCDQDPTAPGGWDPHHPSSHIDGPLQPVAGKALLVRTSTAERRGRPAPRLDDWLVSRPRHRVAIASQAICLFMAHRCPGQARRLARYLPKIQ